jgi:pyrroloquinoline quinone biosynthesis protein E
MKEVQFPEPKADLKSYEETIQRGFKRFPERFSNYQKYKGNGHVSKIEHLPAKMDFENVSRCNLRCEMCQMTAFDKGKRADDMAFDDFKRMLDSLEGVFEIKIQGIGEPFLGKDFTQMVEYANNKDIWTRSTTNATILDRNDNYRRIIDAGIGEIQISVDGTTKTTYEGIRRNAKFEKVAHNCELINKYCDELSIDKTRMWVLLQNENFDELEKFPAFAKELGFKRLTISMDVNGWGNEKKTEENRPKNVSHRITQKDIDGLLAESKALDIDLSFWDITTKYTGKNPCPWPFERAFISSDKKVVPCCMIGNPDIYSFGTLGDFNEIWNSGQYEKFRSAHLSGNIPGVCKYCYEGEGE